LIVLRPPREEDVGAVVAACRDPAVPRWTTIPAPYGEADARAWMAGHEAMRREGRGVCFGITRVQDDRLIGAIDLVVLSWPHACGELGYWLAPEERGRGLAVRAVRLVSDWALQTVGLARLEILAEPGNLPSQRVAERAGFQREGLLRSYRELKGSRRDYTIFSLLAGEPPAPGG
jgi:RimJ/RimL family protein N-acetyltransferase